MSESKTHSAGSDAAVQIADGAAHDDDRAGDGPAPSPKPMPSKLHASFTSAQVRAMLAMLEGADPGQQGADPGQQGADAWRSARLHLDITRATVRLSGFVPGRFGAIWLGFEPEFGGRSASIVLPPMTAGWCGLSRTLDESWPDSALTEWRIELECKAEQRDWTVSLWRQEAMVSYWLYDPSVMDRPVAQIAREHACTGATNGAARRAIEAAARELGLADVAQHLRLDDCRIAGRQAAEFSLLRQASTPAIAGKPAAPAQEWTAPLMQGWFTEPES